MLTSFAAIDLGMKQYMAIAGGGVVVAILGLILRKPLASAGAVPGWIAAAVSGLLLGMGIAFALLFQLGYRWLEQPPVITTMPNIVMGGAAAGQGGGAGGAPMPGGPAMGGGGPGGGAAGGGGPGGGPGGGGPGGGAGGGNRPPVTPNTLLALVGKLELLNRGVKLEITPEQAALLTAALAGIESEESMTNEDAEKTMEKCMAVLTDDQKATVASIDLPRRRGGGGGPGGGGPGGGGPGGGGPGGGGGGGRGGQAGGAGDPPKNPFHGDEGAKSLESLRDRLTSAGK